MSTDIRIIHAHEFIKATPGGQLDLENAKPMNDDKYHTVPVKIQDSPHLLFQVQSVA